MTNAASDAIQCVAIFGFLAVATYSVTSCMTAPLASNLAEMESIKARGEWKSDTGWKAPHCTFPTAAQANKGPSP